MHASQRGILLLILVLTVAACATLEPQSASIAPITEQTNCALLGGCDMNLPRTPQCNCYFNADCVGGGVGFRVCMVNPGECRVNHQASGKINDGMCTFFWWASLQDFDERRRAQETFVAFFGALEAAARTGGVPDMEVIAAARMALPGVPGEAMESLAGSLVVLIIGRAEYPPEHPHRRGSFHFPERDASVPGKLVYPSARIDKVSESELDVLAIVRTAVAEFIVSLDLKALEQALANLATSAPDYTGYGACQYPHPHMGHHDFDYENQFECLKAQVVHAVETLEQVKLPH